MNTDEDNNAGKRGRDGNPRMDPGAPKPEPQVKAMEAIRARAAQFDQNREDAANNKQSKPNGAATDTEAGLTPGVGSIPKVKPAETPPPLAAWTADDDADTKMSDKTQDKFAYEEYNDSTNKPEDTTTGLFDYYDETNLDDGETTSHPQSSTTLKLVSDVKSNTDQSPEAVFGSHIANDPRFLSHTVFTPVAVDKRNHYATLTPRNLYEFEESKKGQALRIGAMLAPSNQDTNNHPIAIPNFANHSEEQTHERINSSIWKDHIKAINMALPTTMTERKEQQPSKGKGAKGKGAAKGKGGKDRKDKDEEAWATNTIMIRQNNTSTVQAILFDWAIKLGIPFLPFICKARSTITTDKYRNNPTPQSPRFHILFCFTLDRDSDHELWTSAAHDLEGLSLDRNEPTLYNYITVDTAHTAPWRLSDCPSGVAKDCKLDHQCQAIRKAAQQSKQNSNGKFFTLVPDNYRIANKRDKKHQLKLATLHPDTIDRFKEAYKQIQTFWKKKSVQGTDQMTFEIQAIPFPADPAGAPLLAAIVYVSDERIITMRPFTDLLKSTNIKHGGDGEIRLLPGNIMPCFRCGVGDHQAYTCRVTPNDDAYRQWHDLQTARTICRDDPCYFLECPYTHFGRTISHHTQAHQLSLFDWNQSEGDEVADKAETAQETPDGEISTQTALIAETASNPKTASPAFFGRGNFSEKAALATLPRTAQDDARALYCSEATQMPTIATPTIQATTEADKIPCEWLAVVLGSTMAKPLAAFIGPLDTNCITTIAKNFMKNNEINVTAKNEIPLKIRTIFSRALGYKASDYNAPLKAGKTMTTTSFVTLAAAMLAAYGHPLCTLHTIANNMIRFDAWGPKTKMIRLGLRLSLHTLEDSDFMLFPLLNDPATSNTNEDPWTPHCVSPEWWKALKVKVQPPPPLTDNPKATLEPGTGGHPGQTGNTGGTPPKQTTLPHNNPHPHPQQWAETRLSAKDSQIILSMKEAMTAANNATDPTTETAIV
jgi:hypothetical protein